MGLFDMVKGDKGQEMTPHKALTCSMLYVMASDGEIDAEAFGITEHQFKPYYDVIVFKNNRKIFK